MYKTCPKCGYTRTPDDTDSEGECPACGLIFEKWLKQRFRNQEEPAGVPPPTKRSALEWYALAAILLEGRRPVTSLFFYLRGILFVGLLVWGWQFMGMEYYYLYMGHRVDIAAPEIYASFMHNINLPFHEAGHVIFRPFGRFMTILGGSLFQVLVPLAVCLVFLFRERDPFAASAGLWWTGQNFMDVAPYINDARAGQIPLIGGGPGQDRPGFHDWTNILTDLGMLEEDHAVAALAQGIGVTLMVTALVWGAAVLFRQYRQLRTAPV